jgi:hypothetical protein
MRRIAPVFLASFLLASVATGVEAQDRGGRAAQQAAPAQGFTDLERQVLSRFFSRNRVEVQSLPPGIARNLARGKPLPPGIAKRSLPPALVAELPQRSGVEITIFGDRIVLLEASGVVVDVIGGILR